MVVWSHASHAEKELKDFLSTTLNSSCLNQGVDPHHASKQA